MRAGTVPFCVLIAAFVLVLSPGSQASLVQDVQQQRVVNALQALRPQVPGAVSAIDWLIRSAGNGIPESTAKNFEGLVDAIRRSEKTGDAAAVVEAVRLDLEIKRAVCRESPEGMRVQVPLTVRTWTASEPRSEAFKWNVHYLSAPLASTNLSGDSFLTFSSPTSASLPPGRYVIWAQDPNDPSRRGPRKDVIVGSPDGKIPPGGVTADIVVAVK